MVHMKLIALSGGIASGKSTVARRLKESGAFHIDADQLAREAVEAGSSGLRQVVERFGTQILDEDGALNREALGQVVFQDSSALADLNGIVHPEVRRLAAERLATIEAQHPEAVVIYDVPLLVEAKVQMPWDLVVIAEAPEPERLRRLVEIRGMRREEAESRIANQATDEERRAIADVVIDTGGSLEQTLEQADALWARLIRPDLASSELS